MPQLTQRFGPIARPITLDASGNGTVTFQPNGSNARITNLFCKVATSTNQAVVTVYRGSIADSNQLFNSNSGSTGFNARGRIDVQDGDTLYVRWTGGDAGAVATATFTGETIPFNEVLGGFEITAEDPIAAGDGSLIYPAIKSPNYVPGVSGWALMRNGDFEAAGAVIRGSVSAANGSIVLDDDGLLVQDTVNGGYVRISNFNFGAYIELQPEPLTGTPLPLGEINPAVIQALSGVDIANLTISSPYLPNAPDTDSAQISLSSASASGGRARITLRPSFAPVSTYDLDVVVDGELYNSDDMEYLRGQRATRLVSFASAAVVSQAVVFPNSFRVGVTPAVFCNINDQSGAVARWTAQATNITNTGFDMLLQKGAVGDANAAWSNIPVQWIAFA